MTSIILDIALITLLAVGIWYATRLIKLLATLRDSRVEMERFVSDFNGSVMRAEGSIKGLKQAARSSGDDLEDLMGKAQKMMDELHFMIESADQIATRLGDTAAKLTAATTKETAQAAKPIITANASAQAAPKAKPPASTAERELLQALEKIG